MRVIALHDLGSARTEVIGLLGAVLPTDAVVVDLPGHGGADEPPSGDWSFDALADSVPLIPDPAAAAWEPVALIGVGMGAAIALRLALRAPEVVERVIAVQPSFADESLPAHLTPFPVIGELLSRYGPIDGEARFRATGPFRTVDLASKLSTAALFAQFRQPRAQERAVRLVELPRNRAWTAAEPAAYPGAVSVIAASRDPLRPIAVAERWIGALPRAELVRVPPRDDDAQAYGEAVRTAVRKALRA